jgi:hypothetical protein
MLAEACKLNYSGLSKNIKIFVAAPILMRIKSGQILSITGKFLGFAVPAELVVKVTRHAVLLL